MYRIFLFKKSSALVCLYRTNDDTFYFIKIFYWDFDYSRFIFIQKELFKADIIYVGRYYVCSWRGSV